METIVQWATMFSPIIAVLLAWWTSKSSTRAANKQIATMKELEKIQIHLLQLQINKEKIDAHLRESQAFSREHEDDHFNNMIGGFHDSLRQMNERKKDLASERQFQAERYQWLQKISETLDEMKKQIK
jgi:hypothetical protein